jgi:hypothetical protein
MRHPTRLVRPKRSRYSIIAKVLVKSSTAVWFKFEILSRIFYPLVQSSELLNTKIASNPPTSSAAGLCVRNPSSFSTNCSTKIGGNYILCLEGSLVSPKRARNRYACAVWYLSRFFYRAVYSGFFTD